MIAACPDCGQREIIPHSCGNRHCPHCQHHEGQEWIERQRAKLLPVDYYLVTFTLPWQLRRLVWQHQRISYDLLLKLGWEVLKTFGLNDSKLKGAIGAHAILHTHSRRLDYHPHAHFVVPAGALDRKHRLWRKKRGNYLFNHEALATVFRAKWIEAMKKAKLKVALSCRRNGWRTVNTWAVAIRRWSTWASTYIAACCKRKRSCTATTVRSPFAIPRIAAR